MATILLTATLLLMLLLYMHTPSYQYGSHYRELKVLPGITLAAESAPKKNKGFRMGVFAALNVYSTFQMERLTYISNRSNYTFQSKINPSALHLGFHFQL
ncbi:MAG: hypothetical protein ACM3VS_18860 [Candidatus Dadabacteria bacterium]